MINALTKLLSWYRSPIDGDTSGASTTALGVLPTRPDRSDIVAYLIHEGHTPATTGDVRAAFAVINDREASDFEELMALDYVHSFGLLA
ncbi:MAG TPA: hypothetical protein H9870_04460 [Candidatus Corynebacterium avicola]|uniref:Uncharacterized protein n=1 Tax=Candidatus Corynebacterium avicola TaxID=2838527 RepID=A0A9D1UKB8_9CORY|nr:hypothetical protein [Candidatus Corynebacterium avicola]